MTPVREPLTIGDMFDRTFRTLGRTLPRSLPVALIMILPPGLLLAAALDMFYSSLGELLPSLLLGAEPEGGLLETMFWSLALSALAGVALFAATVSVRVAVTALSCAELSDRGLTWQQAIAQATGVRFSRAFLQVVLEYAAYGAIIAVGYLIMTVGAAVQLSVLVLLGFLALLGGGLLAGWCAIRWSQTYAVITCEDCGAIGAFGRSSLLVEGSWWRVLGVLLLFGLLKEFVAGLLTTPLSLFAFWEFYESYFALMASPETAISGPEVFADMFASLGAGVGLLATVTVLLSSLIAPVYLSVLYFDLRARAGEFLQPSPAPRGPAQPDATGLVDDDAFGQQPV